MTLIGQFNSFTATNAMPPKSRRCKAFLDPLRTDFFNASTWLPAHSGLVIATFVIMLVTRALPVYSLLAIAASRPPPIPWPWRHLTWWAGLRGALAVALALSVAATPGVDSRVSVVAYGVVLLSLFVQGGLIVPVTRALRVEPAA